MLPGSRPQRRPFICYNGYQELPFRCNLQRALAGADLGPRNHHERATRRRAPLVPLAQRTSQITNAMMVSLAGHAMSPSSATVRFATAGGAELNAARAAQ